MQISDSQLYFVTSLKKETNLFLNVAYYDNQDK